MEAAGQGERGGDGIAQRPKVHRQHGLDDGQRVGEARRAEEHPSHDDEAEIDHPLQRRVQAVIRLSEDAVEHARRPVHQPPEQEEPARAMPKAAEQKDDHQVDAGARQPLPAAAEREIDVGGQEAGERDMPPLPKFADVEALVRRIEVDRNLDVEHQPHAGRHIAVAGKIEIELEGVADGDEPRFRRVERQRVGKARLDRDGERIGDHHLFHQTAREGIQAGGEMIEVEMAVFHIRKLRHDFAVQHDRPRDELGEERDEERVIQNVVARHGALVAVDDVRKLLEGEKRNAQRQRQMVERQMQAERAVQVFKEEIVVFEIKQHAEVEEKPQQHQRQTEGFFPLGEHQLAERVIDQDAARDDRHIARVVVAVKQKRGQHEEKLVELDFFRQSAQQKITKQRQRQKGQHEDVGIEQHGGRCSFSKIKTAILRRRRSDRRGCGSHHCRPQSGRRR